MQVVMIISYQLASKVNNIVYISMIFKHVPSIYNFLFNCSTEDDSLKIINRDTRVEIRTLSCPRE